MSIELKQAAQRALNALDEATTYTGSPSWSPSMTDECIAAASALRTALAQQPVTGEPVWCVATGERVNGEETYTHHDAYVPLADCFPLYTRPAPSVPDDVARNAERWCHAIADGENQSMNFLDIFDDWDGDGDFVEAFDAAMLAAAQAKGGV